MKLQNQYIAVGMVFLGLLVGVGFGSNICLALALGILLWNVAVLRQQLDAFFEKRDKSFRDVENINFN